MPGLPETRAKMRALCVLAILVQFGSRRNLLMVIFRRKEKVDGVVETL